MKIYCKRFMNPEAVADFISTSDAELEVVSINHETEVKTGMRWILFYKILTIKNDSGIDKIRRERRLGSW